MLSSPEILLVSSSLLFCFHFLLVSRPSSVVIIIIIAIAIATTTGAITITSLSLYLQLLNSAFYSLEMEANITE